jgi:glutamyl-Q tRNA(Asp) synthetase
MPAPRYRGRFAPSPTGPLHLGSLVSALASYLDARAQHGLWLVRIEDLDTPRTQPGAAEHILKTLHCYGMYCDAPPLWQSRRTALYQDALARLDAAGWIYPCGCTRKEIADSLARRHAPHERHATLAYPGTCRAGLQGRAPRAWRLRVPDAQSVEADPRVHSAAAGASAAYDRRGPAIGFIDRLQGRVTQDLATEVGDFVLKRADGLWAYQLAVVVDDADTHITDIVRGADLLDSTPRQIYLQGLLALPTPTYLHVPVVESASGEKLSKQTGAQALDLQHPLPNLQRAARHLGLEVTADTLEGFYAEASAAWARTYLQR